MLRLTYKNIKLIILPILTGALLGAAAIPSQFYYLSFVAFIPLLYAADCIVTSKKPILIFAFQLLIALVVFYLMGFYWVLKTANLGFLIAFIIVIPFLAIVPLYVLFKKKGNKLSSLYFIMAWITVEMIQAKFQLGSPFYNLGNNLGVNPRLIQWYEFTGVSGGTIWILTVNFLLYSLIINLKKGRKQRLQKAAVMLAVLAVPIIISNSIYSNYKEKGTSKEVLVVHPSTDNKDVKYRINIYELMDIYLDIMLPELTDNTEYVVLPETAITNAGWVKDFNRNLVFNRFYERTDSFLNLKMITGAVVYEEIPNVEEVSTYHKIPGIRYSEKYKKWYYTYNAALQLDKKQAAQMRVKNGLVPYQEYAPYPTVLPRLTPVGIDFQFSRRDNNRSVFRAANNIETAAIVCYEVVYSKFFNDAVKKGARAFFVLLNEGWYESKRVSQQFLQHSVIRAIENRRSIAHSSNMGISAIVNQRGDVIDKTESNIAGVLRQQIKMNRQVTVAARLGNYIEILALLVTVSLLFHQIIIFFRKQ